MRLRSLLINFAEALAIALGILAISLWAHNLFTGGIQWFAR